jgi:hypothetical protein
MVVHLAQQIALAAGPIDEVPDAAKERHHVASKMAAMAAAMRWY